MDRRRRRLVYPRWSNFFAVKKSIWFISKYASPPQSRGGQRGISLATEFVRAGHNAAVITSTSNHFGTFRTGEWSTIERGFIKASFEGVPMLAHTTIPYERTASAKRVISWLHFEWGLLRLPFRHLPRPTHIIVSSLSLLSILNGYRLARKFDAKLVFEIRDIWPLTLQTEFGFSQKNPMVALLSAIERFGYGKSDVVVGTMPNLREHVRSISGPKPRIETIPLGIDDDLMRLVPKYVAPSRDSMSTIVGYSGSIGRTNSLEVLLDAAIEIGPEKNLEFHFWGGGDLLEKYRETYRGQSHIYFHGHLDRADLFQEVSRSHLLYLATDNSRLWNYGQSLNKMLEYMMIGRPVIASYSGHPSMLDESGSGVFVPAADKESLVREILHLSALPRQVQESLGMKGRDWVRSQRTYAHLSDLYLRMLDSL
jgi:glycosyltransferase involved in cell wall biosynthesis